MIASYLELTLGLSGYKSCGCLFAPPGVEMSSNLRGWARLHLCFQGLGINLSIKVLLTFVTLFPFQNCMAQDVHQITLHYKPALYYKAYQPGAPNHSYSDVCIDVYAVCQAVTEATFIANEGASQFVSISQMVTNTNTTWGTLNSFLLQRLLHVWRCKRSATALTVAWTNICCKSIAVGATVWMDRRTQYADTFISCQHRHAIASPRNRSYGLRRNLSTRSTCQAVGRHIENSTLRIRKGR